MFHPFCLLVRKIHSHNNLPHEAYQLAPKMGQVGILTSLYFFSLLRTSRFNFSKNNDMFA